MVYTDLVKKAMELCLEAHRGQVDKGGYPYVFHPIHLAEQMSDESSVIVALLHDIVEDTEYTIQDLIEYGFLDEVVNAVSSLTHKRGIPYMEYIKQIKTNPIAKKVKLADLRHNSDLSRIPAESENTLGIKRSKKYEEAIKLLEM